MSVYVQPSPNETVTLNKNVIITISVNIIAVSIILVFISWKLDTMSSNTKMQLDAMSSNTKMQLDAVKSEVSALNLRYDALAGVLGNFAKVSDWIDEQFTKVREKNGVKMKDEKDNREKSKRW